MYTCIANMYFNLVLRIHLPQLEASEKMRDDQEMRQVNLMSSFRLFFFTSTRHEWTFRILFVDVFGRHVIITFCAENLWPGQFDYNLNDLLMSCRSKFRMKAPSICLFNYYFQISNCPVCAHG